MNHSIQKQFFEDANCFDLEKVKSFLLHGGDVNIKDEVNNNVLYGLVSMPVSDDALRGEIVNMTKLFIEYGLEVEHKNKWEISVIYEAVGHGFFELVEIFQSLGIKLTSHMSLNEFIFYHWPRHPSREQRSDFPKVLKMLLSEKPDLEFVSKRHNYLTALQIACKEGANDAIFQLLAVDANPNVAPCEYKKTATPLELMCNYAFRAKGEYFETIDALLNAGADPNLYSNDQTQPENSKSALIWAVIYGGNTVKVVERLLVAGAKVTLKDGKGNDAIYYAKESKRDDLVHLLRFYKNEAVENRFTRKASLGKYRVLGYDQYDYRDYFIEEFESIEHAIDLLKERAAKANGTPTSFSDQYFIYNDKEEALYKGTFDDGIEKF